MPRHQVRRHVACPARRPIAGPFIGRVLREPSATGIDGADQRRVSRSGLPERATSGSHSACPSRITSRRGEDHHRHPQRWPWKPTRTSAGRGWQRARRQPVDCRDPARRLPCTHEPPPRPSCLISPLAQQHTGDRCDRGHRRRGKRRHRCTCRALPHVRCATPQPRIGDRKRGLVGGDRSRQRRGRRGTPLAPPPCLAGAEGLASRRQLASGGRGRGIRRRARYAERRRSARPFAGRAIRLARTSSRWRSCALRLRASAAATSRATGA